MMILGTFLLAAQLGVSAPATQPRSCRESFALISALIGKGGRFLGTAEAPQKLLDLKLIDLLKQRNIVFDSREFVQEDGGLTIPKLVALRRAAKKALDQNKILRVLGGDHSIAMATIAAAQASAKMRGKKLGVIWMDAHSDYYYQPDVSYHLHAIVMNQLIGEGNPDLSKVLIQDGTMSPEQILFLGLRDRFSIDADFQSKKFKIISSDDLENSETLKESFKRLELFLNQFDEIHLSFDIDVVNPSELRGFNHPFPGGPDLNTVETLIDFIASSRKLRSADFVEYNPSEDTKSGKTGQFLRDIVIRSLTGHQHPIFQH